MTSADYALSALKDIKKSFDNRMAEKIKSYKDNRIISYYYTKEWEENFISTESMDDVQETSELGTPEVLTLEEGYKVQISPKRFTGAIVVSEQMQLQAGDNTSKVDTYLMRQRNALMTKGIAKMLKENFKFLNEAFVDTGDYLAPDLNPFLGSHTWNSGETFDNGVVEVFSETAVDNAREFGGDFTDAKGEPMVIDYDTIIVKKGSAAAKLAKQLFAKQITPTAVADINIYEGEFIIIETPYITNKLNWFMRDSKLENSLAVGIIKFPSLNTPIKESNEAVRSNLTGFWKQGIVNMPFDWYGSTGAGA